jgi:hypothetical protein
LLPRASVPPFVVVFRSLVAAPFNCVSPLSYRRAGPPCSAPLRGELLSCLMHSCSPLSYRTAARDHLAVPRYLARYLFFATQVPFDPLSGQASRGFVAPYLLPGFVLFHLFAYCFAHGLVLEQIAPLL